MGIYLCTVEEKNLEAIIEKFGPVEKVYRFQPALVIGGACGCGGSRHKQNIVVRITSPRSKVERSSLVARVRTKPPEGGFITLDGPYIHAQSCLGGRDAWGDRA